MASNAIVADPVVSKSGSSPTRGDMTIVTGIRAGDMVRRLANNGVIVVATNTIAKYMPMIDGGHWTPGSSDVAIFAYFARSNMRRTLPR